MAELSEAFELVKLTLSRNTTVQPIVNERCIIISSKENGFSKLDLDRRKSIQSWAINKGQSLSAPAVFDNDLQEYFAVMNNKELFLWAPDQHSLSEANVEMVKTENPIVQLHLISRGRLHDVLLVERTGMTHLKSKLRESSIGDSKMIDSASICKKRYLWSSTVDDEWSHGIFHLVVSEKSQIFNLSVLLVGEEEEGMRFQESHEYTLEPMSKGSHILACTLQGINLIVLWSDNTLCAYSIPLYHNESHQMTLHRTVIQKLPQEFKISGKGNPKPKIGTVDRGHIFLISKYEVDEKKQGVISILNTKYGTEQARTTFALRYSAESSKEQEILSAIFHCGFVVVALSTAVLACSCTINSSSLAAVMGKMKRSETVVHTTEEKSIAAPRKLKKSKKTKGDDGLPGAVEDEQVKCLERLADPSKTPTVADFNRELNAFLKLLHLKVSGDANLKDNSGEGEPVKKKKKREQAPRKYLIPEVFVQTVIKRCREDDNIWSSRVPVHLLELHCVPPSLCSDLIAESIKRQSLDVLNKCFDCTDGINEKDIVKSIQFLLSTKATIENWKKPEFLDGDLIENFVRIDDDHLQTLINIFNCCYNEYALQDMLRILSIQETKELLQILFELLSRHKLGTHVPVSHERVVDWLSMVINAQFTTLMLTDDVPLLLKQIQQTVSRQMKSFRDFEYLEHLLAYSKRSRTLPNVKEIVGVYSIDNIRI